MKKIVVVGDLGFSTEQKERLGAVGEVSYIPIPDSSDKWLEEVRGMDVICSDGDYLLENLEQLENVLVTYPYIELGSFDSKKLAERGVYVANTSGSNRDSIVEWVMFMVLALFRKFIPTVRTTAPVPFARHQSLVGKQALIVGKGSIGTQIGKVCEAFGMDVDFFGRGDDIRKKAESADLVINALNSNPTSKNLIDESAFMAFKKGSYFVSFVRPHTYDAAGLIKAIDAGIVAGAAIDCDPQPHGDIENDFYKMMFANEKILVTPHVAFATEQAGANGAEFLIQNVESYLTGTPKNIILK